MDNKLKAFAISLLRKGTFKWVPRKNVKNEGRKQIKVGNRELWHYQCALCPKDKWYRDKDIVMDHILPVVDEKLGFQGFDTYIERMYPYEAGWQRLCVECHDKKTLKENETRKVSKKKKKALT